MVRTILVTGGAGFIGSNFVLQRIAAGDRVVNLDKLTYAGNLGNLVSIKDHPAHIFVHGGIEDAALVQSLFQTHKPGALVNFAAESHVDRSIASPEEFISTNVVGTFRLLLMSRLLTTGRYLLKPSPASDFSTFLLTKCTGHSAKPTLHSRRLTLTSLTVRTRLPRPVAITSCAPTITPTDCRR